MCRNKFLGVILVSCFLSVPCFANIEQGVSIEIETPAQELLDNTINEAIENSQKEVITPHVEDLKEMTPNANNEVKNEVLNDTNNAFKFTIKKFLCAMTGVLISSFVVFGILVLMNKINRPEVETKNVFTKNEEEDAPLVLEEIQEPNGENQALKIFLEKTK